MSPTPAEIISARGKLSQVAAAAMIPGVSVSTWRAWEYGQNPMHPGLWELFNLKIAAGLEPARDNRSTD